MSFECKYKNNDRCELRGLECDPGAKGCVLVKKVKFVDAGRSPADNEQKENK